MRNKPNPLKTKLKFLRHDELVQYILANIKLRILLRREAFNSESGSKLHENVNRRLETSGYSSVK